MSLLSGKVIAENHVFRFPVSGVDANPSTFIQQEIENRQVEEYAEMCLNESQYETIRNDLVVWNNNNRGPIFIDYNYQELSKQISGIPEPQNSGNLMIEQICSADNYCSNLSVPLFSLTFNMMFSHRIREAESTGELSLKVYNYGAGGPPRERHYDIENAINDFQTQLARAGVTVDSNDLVLSDRRDYYAIYLSENSYRNYIVYEEYVGKTENYEWCVSEGYETAD